jgi:hypothetical protein
MFCFVIGMAAACMSDVAPKDWHRVTFPNTLLAGMDRWLKAHSVLHKDYDLSGAVSSGVMEELYGPSPTTIAFRHLGHAEGFTEWLETQDVSQRALGVYVAAVKSDVAPKDLLPLQPRDPEMDAIVQQIHSSDKFTFEAASAAVSAAVEKVKEEVRAQRHHAPDMDFHVLQKVYVVLDGDKPIFASLLQNIAENKIIRLEGGVPTHDPRYSIHAVDLLEYDPNSMQDTWWF